MQSNSTKSLIEGALLAAINVILSLMAIYMPIIGTFATLVWPVPIVILVVRHGMRTATLSMIVAGIIVAMVSGPFQAVGIVLGFGILGLVIGWAIKKDVSSFKVIAFGSVASMISILLLMLISMWVMGINPITQELDILKESISMTTEFYNKLGVDPKAIETTVESFNNALAILPLIIPAIFIVASVFDAFLTYMITKAVMSRMGQKLRDFTPFVLWRFPDYTVAIFLLGSLLIMLEPYWPNGILKAIGMNLVIVFGCTLFLQGLSLLTYYLAKFNVGKFFRAIIAFFVLFNPLFLQIVFFAGFFDVLFNFRKI